MRAVAVAAASAVAAVVVLVFVVATKCNLWAAVRAHICQPPTPDPRSACASARVFMATARGPLRQWGKSAKVVAAVPWNSCHCA